MEGSSQASCISILLQDTGGALFDAFDDEGLAGADAASEAAEEVRKAKAAAAAAASSANKK